MALKLHQLDYSDIRTTGNSNSSQDVSIRILVHSNEVIEKKTIQINSYILSILIQETTKPHIAHIPFHRLQIIQHIQILIISSQQTYAVLLKSSKRNILLKLPFLVAAQKTTRKSCLWHSRNTSDVNIQISRFLGKYIYKTTTRLVGRHIKFVHSISQKKKKNRVPQKCTSKALCNNIFRIVCVCMHYMYVLPSVKRANSKFHFYFVHCKLNCIYIIFIGIHFGLFV